MSGHASEAGKANHRDPCGSLRSVQRKGCASMDGGGTARMCGHFKKSMAQGCPGTSGREKESSLFPLSPSKVGRAGLHGTTKTGTKRGAVIRS